MQASLKTFLIIFGILCTYTNKNYFLLQTSNSIQKTRMKFTLWESLSGYNI